MCIALAGRRRHVSSSLMRWMPLVDLEAVTKAIATARLGPVLRGWKACSLRSCQICAWTIWYVYRVRRQQKLEWCLRWKICPGTWDLIDCWNTSVTLWHYVDSDLVNYELVFSCPSRYATARCSEPCLRSSINLMASIRVAMSRWAVGRFRCNFWEISKYHLTI